MAQTKTSVLGKVTDASTGEALPFVQVAFQGSTTGTVTDFDGRFSLADTLMQATLVFRMMGYEPLEMNVTPGRTTRGLKVRMVPQARNLQEVTISSSRNRRRRYSRKNNPAVDLAEQVIAHRDQCRLEGRDSYSRKVYKKLTLALDDFHPDFHRDPFWRHLKFAEKYIDQTPFDATPILTVSMRESMLEESFIRQPSQHRSLLTAYRMEGIDQAFEQEGFDESLTDMFTSFDIYDADIELMMNHFVGPLSPSSATSFYHYYITDTTWVDGVRCVELSFVPANRGLFGFTGHLYIALDSTYRVARYSMTVTPKDNLNFVRDLHIEQQYIMLSDGTYAPGRQDIHCRLYLHRKLRQLYAHQVLIAYQYKLGADMQKLPDSLFSPMVTRAVLPGSTQVRRKVWNAMRPIELTFKETLLDSLRFELARLPWARALKTVGEVMFTDYLPTASVRDSSRIDIGPVFNTVSYNREEGWRLRLGAMTKAPLNNHHFAEAYLAYGFLDQRPKGAVTYTYTFDPKRRHPHESPLNLMQFSLGYDLQTPGQSYGNFTRDNIFSSTSEPSKAQYVGTLAMRWQHQWSDILMADAQASIQCFEPAGLLNYSRIMANGSTQTVDRFNEAAFQFNIRFAPLGLQSGGRPSASGTLRRHRQGPLIHLGHRLGYMSPQFLYNTTTLRLEQRTWLGAFGFLDAQVRAAVVWNRVPYIRLHFPDAGASLWMTDGAFNSMQPMEFVMDRHVALYTTWHLRGLILGRLPWVRNLRLREVLGCNVLYGGLSPINDPQGPHPAGLFVLPDGVGRLDGVPFVEVSAGIENIFRILRVDYVWRLTHRNPTLLHNGGGLRVGLRLAF